MTRWGKNIDKHLSLKLMTLEVKAIVYTLYIDLADINNPLYRILKKHKLNRCF